MENFIEQRIGEAFTPEGILAHLGTSTLGRRIEVHPQVGSTNDLAREAGRRGEPEGLVILAEEQVKGRGRLGRVWTAPQGCCILCSVLLRPRFSPEHAFYITIAASLAIYRACVALFDQEASHNHELNKPQASSLKTPTIKWPNDVLVDGRKVSGVLSEAEFSGHDWAFAVVGFGINVNLRTEQFGELQSVATSLSAELGRPVDRAKLIAHVLQELESLYLLLQGGQFGPVHSQWARALETTGKQVTVREAAGIVEGKTLRVDPDGALVIRTRQGEEKRVLAGDVLPGNGQ